MNEIIVFYCMVKSFFIVDGKNLLVVVCVVVGVVSNLLFLVRNMVIVVLERVVFIVVVKIGFGFFVFDVDVVVVLNSNSIS